MFIDESGNTGRDIYELQQPFLTYSGIWLDAAHEAAASNQLDHLVEAHRLQQKGELKGKSILNSRGGRLVVRDLLRWLRKDQIAVTTIAVEKAFMAAGVLVETAQASTMRVALIEESTKIVERSRDYLADLQALLASQPDVENSPFVIGSESWQLAAMTLLLGRDPRYRG